MRRSRLQTLQGVKKNQSKPSLKNKKNTPVIVLGIFLLLCLLYVLFKGLFTSPFVQHTDRLNIIVAQEGSMFYSMGLEDGVNYFLSYFPDLEVDVPGGYGRYRIGALPKLASLEKKPDIFRKTYSLATGSMVNYYFYPSSSSNKIGVYFGEEKKDFMLPKFNLIFFGNSNAHFFDRLYIYLLFLGKTKGQFKLLGDIATKTDKESHIFLSDEFFETYQGIFYKATYRKESKSVQILYPKSYSTAQAMGRILEGEGIHVVDLDVKAQKGRCSVGEDSTAYSKTAQAVARFFSCSLRQEKTGAYDIIVTLGDTETEWEVE